MINLEEMNSEDDNMYTGSAYLAQEEERFQIYKLFIRWEGLCTCVNFISSEDLVILSFFIALCMLEYVLGDCTYEY